MVKACAAGALHERRFLIDLVHEAVSKRKPDNRVDWAALARPENHLGQAQALIERALERIDGPLTRALAAHGSG